MLNKNDFCFMLYTPVSQSVSEMERGKLHILGWKFFFKAHYKLPFIRSFISSVRENDNQVKVVKVG